MGLNPHIELVHRQLATFEALRRLGFAADDIHVDADSVTKKVMTLLKAQGKEFRIEFFDVPMPTSIEDYQKSWTAEAARWTGDMSEAEMDRIYRKHYDVEKLASLAMALHEKGFEIPEMD